MAWVEKVKDLFALPNAALESHTPNVGDGYVDVDAGLIATVGIGPSGRTCRSTNSGGVNFSRNLTVLANDQAAVLIVGSDADANNWGMLTRSAGTSGGGAASTTGYLVQRVNTTDVYQLYRDDNGSYTQLGSDVSAAAPVEGKAFRLESVSTQHTVLYDAVQQIQQTDATYASGTASIRAAGNNADFAEEFYAYEDTGAGYLLVKN